MIRAIIKKVLPVIFLLSTSSASFCQDTIKHEPIFQFVEEPPMFPGGEDKLMEYLGRNIKYPVKARDNGISGRVYITFVVDSSGSIKDVKILKGIEGLNEEALRVVNMMPKWTPGKQNGRNVMVQYNLPIVFSLSEGKSTPQLIANMNATIKYNNGNEFMKTDDFTKAIMSYTDAILYNTRYVDAYFNRAVCFKKLGFETAACKDWNRALQLGDQESGDLVSKNCGAVDSANLIQTDPEFIEGGYPGLVKFLYENINYPEFAKTNGIEGMVQVRMVVDSLGYLTEAKVEKGIGGSCDEEAIRLVKKIKKWNHGTINGEPANTVSILPVRFKLKK